MSAEWIERAFSKTLVNKETGCWEYDGEIVHNGYGRISTGSRNVRIHRLSYAFFRGLIPDDLLVCHRCDVRNCWNPEHLFLGSAHDNVHDMISKGRSGKGYGAAKLTEIEVAQLRAAARAGELCVREYARSRRLKPGTVREAVKGITWRHVSAAPFVGTISRHRHDRPAYGTPSI